MNPQIIGGGPNMQEKAIMAAMESCGFKAIFSGVAGYKKIPL